MKRATLLPLLLLATRAQADELADTFHKSCAAAPAPCVLYVRGFMEGFTLGRVMGRGLKGDILCVPEAATSQHGLDVFLRYLRDHPEERHKQVAALLFTALESGWPCPPG
jgi:hypothetical protein